MAARRRRALTALLLAGLVVAASCAAPAAGPAAGSTAGGGSAGGAAGAAGPAASATAAPVRLVASYSEVLATQLPAWVAQETGLFQQKGLDVDQQLIESATGVPALIAGETQIAQIGGSSILGAVVGGSDLVVVGVQAPVYPYIFQAHPSIRTIEGLRGQKVGVSRFGSSSDTGTRVSLRKLGLDPDRDLSIIQVGSASARTAAMLSGAIQGAVGQPPDTLVLDAHGFNTLFDLASVGLPASQTAIAVQRTFAVSQRDALQRYVDAVIEGAVRVRQDRPLSLQLLKKYLRLDDDVALEATYDYYTSRVLVLLPYPRPEQFADGLEHLAERNEQARGYDVTRMIDASFVQDAEARGLGR